MADWNQDPTTLDEFYQRYGNWWTDGTTDERELAKNPMFLDWQKTHPGQDVQEFKNEWYGHYNRLTGKTPAGASGDPVNADDLASKRGSWSGIPEWARGYFEQLLAGGGGAGPGAAGAFGSYGQAIQDLNNAPKFINQQMGLSREGYQRNLALPMQKTIRSVLGRSIGRGTAGSSMFGDTMSLVGEQLARGATDANRDINLWGAGAKLNNLGQKVQANAGMASMFGDLLNGSRESRTWSYSPNFLGMDFSAT